MDLKKASSTGILLALNLDSSQPARHQQKNSGLETVFI